MATATWGPSGVAAGAGDTYIVATARTRPAHGCAWAAKSQSPDTLRDEREVGIGKMLRLGSTLTMTTQTTAKRL